MEKEEAAQTAALSELNVGGAPGSARDNTPEDWRARQDRIIAEEQAKRVKVPMGRIITAILIANGITIAILYLCGVIHK